MDFLGFLVTQCLNALSQAAMLFFIAGGLTLIFGIMRIVNFAHGVIFMLGAYVGYTAVAVTGSFWAALIARAVGGRRVGGRSRWAPAAPLPARRRRLPDGDVRADAGPGRGHPPDLGRRGAAGAGTRYPVAASSSCSTSRSRSIGCSWSAPASSSRIAIWQFLERTRLGLLIRATSQNAEMVHALGIDVRLVRSACSASAAAWPASAACSPRRW